MTVRETDISARKHQAIGVSAAGGLAALMKVHLCLYIAGSAMAGYLMAGGRVSPRLAAAGIGVFILACGSAVLNNIQDRHFDRCFKRTANRGLATGTVRLKTAWFLSGLLILSGTGSLLLFFGCRTTLMGITALLCYNLLYTPLKKRTLLAMIPGAATGMVVPLIGWSAGNGAFPDPVALNLSVVLGVWQIPHFLILQLRYRDPASPDSGRTTFPSIFTFFSFREVKILVLLWTCLYSLSVWHLLILFPMHPLWMLAVLVNISMTILMLALTSGWSVKTPSRASVLAINFSMLCFMFSIIMDTLQRTV